MDEKKPALEEQEGKIKHLMYEVAQEMGLESKDELKPSESKKAVE